MRYLLLISALGLSVSGQSGPAEDRSRAMFNTAMGARQPDAKATSGKGKAAPTAPPATRGVVGVTLWRLRPIGANDDRSRALVHPDSDGQQKVLEQFAANEALQEGQQLRLAIESANQGYLYVLSHEQYANGSTSDPILIFPTTRLRGGNHSVESGRPVEIPAWEDTPPYFKLVRSRPDQVAEVLTLIVSPKPLAQFQPIAAQQTVSKAMLDQLKSRYGVGTSHAQSPPGGLYRNGDRAAAGGGAALGLADPLPLDLYLSGENGDGAIAVSFSLRFAAR